MLTDKIESEILQAINGALKKSNINSNTSVTKKKDSKNDVNKSKDNLENILKGGNESGDGVDLESGVENEINPNVIELVDYSKLAEDFHIHNIQYGGDFEELSYLSSISSEHEAKYKEWEEEVVYALEDSATMDDVEAEDTIQEVIYATILGSDDVSFEKKKRLSNWMIFEKTLSDLYQQNAVVRTIDVNFGTY